MLLKLIATYKFDNIFQIRSGSVNMSMPEDKNNVPFYTKHSFSVMEDGAAVQICNSQNLQE